MHVFNQPGPGPLSFGVVKQILREFGLTSSAQGAIAQSMRIFWPLDSELAERVRTGATSLTDASTSEEQIRFFQRHRVRRSYVKVATAIAERHGRVQVRIGNCHYLDEPSREFLTVASEVCGWHVEYTSNMLPVSDHLTGWSVEDEEVLRITEGEYVGRHIDELWVAAFEFVNVGDAWSGVALGRVLAQYEQTPRVWNLLALGYAMLNETENAEFYYRLWAASGNELDRVRAYYGIAMLYARHHPLGLRDLGVAEGYLGEAYEILQQMSASTRSLDAIVFEEVFNRNGYALILFRRGEVKEALALLEWGISRLSETSEKVAIHRSVLMYNLAQCRRQLGERQAAVAAYEGLLEVDPHMPEYHFEAAKCYADAGELLCAIKSVKAGLKIDDSLASGWSLLGVYLERAREMDDASRAFQKGHHLDPASPKYALDYAYTLVLNNQTRQARSIIRRVSPANRAQAERRANLLAESWVKDNKIERAIEEIEAAMKILPDSTVLEQNLSILRAK